MVKSIVCYFYLYLILLDDWLTQAVFIFECQRTW